MKRSKFFQTTPFQIVVILQQALHLVIEDATGDSAVIEYIDGKAKIYHGREYTVATNSPTFDKQIEHLKEYKMFGGEKPLPGDNRAGRPVRQGGILPEEFT